MVDDTKEARFCWHKRLRICKSEYKTKSMYSKLLDAENLYMSIMQMLANAVNAQNTNEPTLNYSQMQCNPTVT